MLSSESPAFTIKIQKYFYIFFFNSRRIQEAQNDLELSSYYQSVSSKLKSILNQNSNRLICIGIGHFSDCLISRHQLAFILSIKNQFDISSIEFHEPILTRGEVSILKTFNCSVVAENLEGKIEIDSKTDLTIVYAPHCPKQLINNFLWKNWSSEQLKRLVYIGNSFTNLLNSTPSRFLATDAGFIVKIQSHCEEIELDNKFKFTDIFNDTSVHRFHSSALENSSEEFWTKTEPVYQSDNLELITAALIEQLKI